jgi:hypothetical protein
MFNKIFKTLSKTFAGKEDSRQEVPAPTRAPAPPPAKSGSLLDKLSGTPPPSEKKKERARVAPTPTLSPDELCGITPSMNKDQVRGRLAMLYRRHNRATSSLDAKMRAEAEKMLGAIVLVREKHFGPI